ncbi:MAG: hypothetical protein IJI58_02890 [Bacilli bacterium]|nr:hypothetical protein [Bacilli bacterium]
MKGTGGDNLKLISKIVIASALISYLMSKGTVKFTLEKYNVDNIYNNKNLKISEERADELFQLLEEESGNYNLDNERDLILTAAIENPNLSNVEKKVIYNLVDLIEEVPYIDKRVAYANLKELDILYDYENYNGTHLGDYVYNTNEIKIYYDTPNHDVLIHELIHSLFLNIYTNKLPYYFKEGVTELLQDEYFSDNPYFEESSYPYEIAMVKILCDMVGFDVVLKTYTTGDMSEIEKELNKYMVPEETKKYLENIEMMFDQFEEKDITDFDYMSNFLDYTKAFFEKKYLKSNKIYESYEYNKELIIKMVYGNSGNNYVEYLEENGYYVKPYFSKKLKEKDKEYHFEHFEDNEIDKALKKYKLI